MGDGPDAALNKILDLLGHLNLLVIFDHSCRINRVVHDAVCELKPRLLVPAKHELLGSSLDLILVQLCMLRHALCFAVRRIELLYKAISKHAARLELLRVLQAVAGPYRLRT